MMSKTIIINVSVVLLFIATTKISCTMAQSVSKNFGKIENNSAFTWNSVKSTDPSFQSAIKFSPRTDINVVSWEFGNTNTTETSPTYTFNSTSKNEFINVTLTYTLNDSSFTETRKIPLTKATKDVLANIPNVFTPNEDGSNDFFTFASTGTPWFTLRIFSRSGALLYQTEAETIMWDGKNEQGNTLPDGIYYYVIEDSSGLYEPATGFVYIYGAKK